MLAQLGHIRNWIFDLDNTLYPASSNLFELVDARINAYVARRLGLGLAEARAVQKGYFYTRGTTMAGLMAEHGVDPHEYLAFVHDIEMDALEHNAPLVAAVAKLPGRKLIFTNADAPYAQKVLARVGLHESFEAIHDIHATDYRPKPELSAYQGLCEAYGLDPNESLFADDMTRNLKPAKAIGMATLWVDNGSEQAPGETEFDYIDHRTGDLAAWLHDILEKDA